MGCIKGKKVECVEILKKGDLLGISPGGLREANFSDKYYNTVWGTGIGFAQVALETQMVSDCSLLLTLRIMLQELLYIYP